MPLANSKPIKFRPRSLSDTLDEGNAKAGACSSLQNLIPDPSTLACVQCRPAAFGKYNFSDFNTPGIISAAYQLGSKVYGMIATARNPGHDEPFIYDLNASAIVAVGGTVNNTTTPLTPSSVGSWTPPTMSVMGTMVIVTHPGFPGGGGAYFGWFDITTPGSPVWHAGNTVTNALPSVPTFVAQFNNRAYFACGNAANFTDALTNPPTITNATNVLIIGDTAPITALCPLAETTFTNAISQALIAFKDNYIAQITGDPATNDLAQNGISPQGVGTSAPRSVCTTPVGILFVDDDGVRTVTQLGTITDPIEDVRLPFINPVQRSRISAAYDNGVYRVCVQNGSVLGNPYQEFWYDFKYKMWTGPHTFRQDLALAYNGTFTCFSNAELAILFQSDTVQNSGSGFVENGTPLSWNYSTSPLKDLENLNANSAIETTLNLAYAGNTQILCAAISQNGGTLSTCFLNLLGALAIWGAFLWGAVIWFGAAVGLQPYRIPWTNALVFTKLTLQFTGASVLGLKLSNIEIRYQPLNYIQN